MSTIFLKNNFFCIHCINTDYPIFNISFEYCSTIFCHFFIILQKFILLYEYYMNI